MVGTSAKSSSHGSATEGPAEITARAAADDDRHSPRRRRSAILSGAEQEFAQSGYDRTKVAAIAKRAGYPLAVVYRTFPGGKMQIWNELNADRFNDLVSFVLQNSRGESLPAKRMLDNIRSAYIYLCNHPNFLELHFREGFNWATASDYGRGTLRQTWTVAVDIFIEMAAADGGVAKASHFSPSQVARLAISTVQIWLHEWWHSSRETDIEEDADRLVSFLSLWLRDEN